MQKLEPNWRQDNRELMSWQRLVGAGAGTEHGVNLHKNGAWEGHVLGFTNFKKTSEMAPSTHLIHNFAGLHRRK